MGASWFERSPWYFDFIEVLESSSISIPGIAILPHAPVSQYPLHVVIVHVGASIFMTRRRVCLVVGLLEVPRSMPLFVIKPGKWPKHCRGLNPAGQWLIVAIAVTGLVSSLPRPFLR